MKHKPTIGPDAILPVAHAPNPQAVPAPSRGRPAQCNPFDSALSDFCAAHPRVLTDFERELDRQLAAGKF